MRNWTKRILGLIFAIFAGQSAFATHTLGAEMQFSCINACTVQVQLGIYSDCGGGTMASSNLLWTPISGNCSTVPSNLGNTTLGSIELTPVCPSVTTTCTNPSSSIYGILLTQYLREYEICSTPNCIFNVSWTACCRNGAVINLDNPASQAVGLGNNTFNTGLANCNNSPIFNTPLPTMICDGQSYDFFLGGIDPDGDSLSYELSPCYQGYNTLCTYAAGYSPNTPFGNQMAVTFDAVTGVLHLQPTGGGNMVAALSYLTYEWRNGVVINTYQREAPIIVFPCGPNNRPGFAGISNLSSGSVIGDDIYVCSAGAFCFDVTGVDPDSNQGLRMFWDGYPAGASFVDANNASVTDTVLGSTSNPPVGRFCWTPPSNGVYQLHLRIEDDFCPFYAQFDKLITIHVGGGASSASASLSTCPDVDFVALGCGTGPFTYVWSGAGGLSNTAQSFSHTYPSAGSYPWQVIISDGTVTDTIMDTIVVGQPQFDAGLLGGTNVVAPCVGLPYDTLMGPGGFASYLWSTGASSQDLPVFLGGNYGLTVTAANGCQSYDSTELYWAEPYIYGIANTSTGAPLMNQKIMLIKHDTATNYLYRLDSTYTDSSGYYYFCTTWDTVMYIKALPSLFAYPLEMPTYADSTLFWYNAIPFYGLTQVPFRHDFATISGLNPGGLGFIGGYISQGANKTSGVGDPIVGLNVFLFDRNSGDLMGQSITNPFGYFNFSNLPAGDYEFKVDVPNMYNPNPPMVTLGTGQMHLDSLDLRLHSTYLELVTATSLEPIPAGFSFQAVPNPFEGGTQLILNLEKGMTMELEILDAQGKLIQQIGKVDLAAGQHKMQIGSDFPSGMYFAKLKSGDGQQVLKVMKL